MQAVHPRASLVGDVEKCFGSHPGLSRLDLDGNVSNTIREAIELVEPGELLVICGSTAFQAEARAAVGIIEPIDKMDLQDALLL